VVYGSGIGGCGVGCSLFGSVQTLRFGSVQDLPPNSHLMRSGFSGEGVGVRVGLKKEEEKDGPSATRLSRLFFDAECLGVRLQVFRLGDSDSGVGFEA